MPNQPPSPTLSSASSSSPGRPPRPSPFVNVNPTHRPRTMEDLWKRYNLPTLPARDRRPVFVPAQTALPLLSRNFVCQDFLSRPFVNDTSARKVRHGGPAIFDPPSTVLSLNASGRHTAAPAAVPVACNTHMQPNPNRVASPSEALASSSRLSPLKEGLDRINDEKRERKKQRMIKNRASAARSRARRQAYANQLEKEIRNLLADNDRLKREHREMVLATATAIPKKRKYRRRCSSAPL